MRLRTQPQRPTNPLTRHKIEVEDGDNLGALIDQLPDGIDPSDVCIEKDWFRDYCEIYLCWQANKYTPDEWEKVLQKYNKRLEDYKQWYKENKEEIDAELEKRRLIDVEKEKKRLQKLLREKDKLEKQIKKLQS